MSFDDALIGGGADFDPRAATEDLIRQTSGGSAVTLEPRMLRARQDRKLGEPTSVAAPQAPTAPTIAEPAAAPDFSAQAVPAPEGALSTLDFSSQATEPTMIGPQPRPQSLPAPQATQAPPATTEGSNWTDYPVEFGKGVTEGSKNMGASALKGVAAAGLPGYADPVLIDELATAKDMTPSQRAKLMGRAIRGISDIGLQRDYNAALRRISSGADPAAEIEGLKPRFEANNTRATTPVKDTPLYKAGEAVEEFGKEALAPRPGFEPGKSWTRDIGAGAGSMVAGIGVSMIPGIGPAAAGALFTTAGMGEAAEKAVKEGATNDQIRRATLLGGVAGATDMVDALIPMLGTTGKVLGFVKRMGLAAIKGAIMEGGQEGVQQLMQNAIAKGIYKPDQDMWEDVPRSVAIAAILGGVGGGISGAATRGERAPAAAPGASPGAAGPDTTAPDAGGPSSPEDIADFIKRAREGAPEHPESTSEAPSGPDPASMSETERMHAYTASRESHGGASETDILKAAGLDPATMDDQERIDAVIRATKPADASSNPSGNAQAKPEDTETKEAPKTEESHLRYAVLRESGWTDEDIDNMPAAQRKAEFDSAIEDGIKPGAAMTKHPKRSRKTTADSGKSPDTTESDVGATAAPKPSSAGLDEMGSGMAAGMGDSLRDHLWERVQAGKTNENDSTGHSALLQGAKMARARGGLKTRDEFVAYADEQAQLTAGSATFQQDMRALVDKHSPKGGDGTRKAPSRPHSADDVRKAQPAQPTEAQAAAENYKHAHLELPQLGLTGRRKIAVETGVGGTRKGTDSDGKPWEVKLTEAAYGRIGGTVGADGQPLDIFIGPHPTSEQVFVVDQHHPGGGGFDEHKIMAGFRTPIDALHAYGRSYNDQGGDRIGHVTAMDAERFREWLDVDDTTKALGPEVASGSGKATPGPSTEVAGTTAAAPKETPAATPGAKPDDRSAQKTATPAARSNSEPLSLLQFIASKGGLAPHPELDALDIGDQRAQIPGKPGFFGIIRPTGMSIDNMREAAEEAGYFRGEHNKTSTLRDFLDAVDTELRGGQHRAEGEEGKATKKQRTSQAESSAAARDKTIGENVEAIRAEYTELPEGLAEQAAAIMADERLDIDSAVEMAAVRAVNEDADYEIQPNDITATYGEGVFDAIQPNPASEDGRTPAPAGDQEQQPGEGEKAGGDGEHDAVARAEGGEAQVARPYPYTADRTQPTQITPLPIELKEFEETTDEWAALFTDPGQQVNLENQLRKGPFIPLEEAQKRVDQWRADAAAQNEDGETRQANSEKTILSLYDLTGNWARPWAEAGYNVLMFDIQSGQDVHEFSVEYFNENHDISDVYGILIAQPCTDFAVSGAKHFAAKDARGDTAKSIDLVHQSLRTVEYFRPKFWVLENPMSRIEKLTSLPKWRLIFNPNNFGEPYTKKTALWGKFNADLPTANVEPTEGSKMWARYGGKSEATKNARSATPEGFAYAFFKANNYADQKPEARLDMDYPEISGAVKAAFDAGFTEPEIRKIVDYDYGDYEYDKARGKLIAAVKAREPTRLEKTITRSRATADRINDREAEREKEAFAQLEGEQTVLPGTEPIGQGEQAQREADKPLKPTKPQKAADDGLFGDTMDQRDLQLVPPPRPLADRPKIDRLLVDEGYKLDEDGLDFRAYVHSENADPAQVRRVANLAKSQGFTESVGLRSFKNPETGERIDIEPGGEDTSGHYLFIGSDQQQRVEDALGEDASKVAPVDIARAAEIMADNPGMPPETAFGQAVVLGAVEQGFITQDQAEAAYGPKVGELLESEQAGTPVRGGDAEQERAEPDQIGPGGAAQTGELPGGSEARSEGASGEAAASSPDAVDGTAPSGGEAARDQASDTVEDRTPAEIAANTRKLTDRQLEMLASYADGNEATDFADFAAADTLAWRNRERVIDALHKKKLLDPDGLTEAGWLVLAREQPNNKDVLRRAERDAPTWAEILAELPMSPDGRTRQHEIAFDLMTGMTGDPRPKYADLTPAQKTELLATLRGTPAEPTFATGEPDGVQAPVHAGDAPAGPEAVQPAEPVGGTGSARQREGGGSEQAVPRADGERAEGEGRVPEGAGSERGDRTGDGGDARLPEGRADDAADGRAGGDERPTVDVAAENHVITPGSLDEGRSQKQKAKDNIRALEITQKIELLGRPAHAFEQTDLAKYVGWGGIKGAFRDTDGTFSEGLSEIGQKLEQLLTPEEHATARRSIQYAHYTAEDVVRSMWDAVLKMGFTGGQVFEPGMGVGNFAGMMPQDVAANSHYQGVELDHTTARIAKLLYPGYGVRQDDFTKTQLPENSYDLVIGNPPFADVAIRSDPKYKQGFLLHDYFFAKSIDAVRPGGLLAFVTSAGTMNKLDTAARDYLADRADLVGAIRLPGDAFKKNAGTEVTTDIIFLRKRLPGDIAGDRTWTETTVVSLPSKAGMSDGNVNRYFAEHPEMVLGKADFNDKLYPGRYSVKAEKGSDLKANLAKAIESLPANVMSAWADVNADHHQHDFDTTEKKEGTYYVGPDGALHQVTNGVGQKVGQRGKGVENGRTAADMERIKALVPVRDALRQVYAADLKGDTANADRARAALNKAYDAFTAAHGPINKAVIQTRRPNVIQMENARAEAREEARYGGFPFREGSFDATELLDAKTPLSVIARKRQEMRADYAARHLNFDEGDFDVEEVPDVIIDKRPNVDPFMDDPESYRLRAIERYDEGSGQGHKSPVFYENIITREVVPKISSVNDGLLYSLSQYGRVNIPAIAELTKKSEAEVIEQLGEQVFKRPGTKDTFETRDEYLSGNVRKKLEQAQRAADRNPEFRRNVAALEANQPMPLAPSQIHANLGMPWIPQAVIEKFGLEEMGLEKVKVRYTAALASWQVSGDTDSVAARSTWGTEDRRAPALMQDALNRQTPKVYDKGRDEHGRETSTLNVAKTEAANDKMMQIREKFAAWVWTDQERSDTLAAYYNENFNNLVVREYNGDYLTTPGIASHWSWRPHQKRVIARIIQSGNTYVAHAVGAGKTSEYIGAIMEMRRLGLVRKPMVAVPNHMLAQFTKEWYEQYPTARLAIADDRRFHTDRRKQFIANVALDDLDAIIITHSSFGMIPVSAAFQNGVIEKEIHRYREVLAEFKATGDGSRVTRSRIEKQIERLEQRLVSRTGRKDSTFTFEEMGVDHLTIDEAHLFRKLDFSTLMSNLKGVSPEGSQMAWDLYVKSLYLDNIRPGRGLVMGSGTPITNTMAELYTLSRYMQPSVLADRGLEKFDAWAGAFGESVSELEQDPAGGYKPVSRFAKFVNVAELSAMVRQIMDVVTSKQLEQYVTRPAIRGGKRVLHLAEKSRELVRFQEGLAARMIAIQKRKGPPKKGDDIMLSVINDGRHAAIDMRLAGGSASNTPSKLEEMVDNLYQEWAATKRQKFYNVKAGGGYDTSKPAFVGPATQLAFTNLGLSGGRGFSVPDYIRAELHRRGVPKNEIAYIYDYKSATAKQRLFNDMNEGKVRILIGSVAKIGVGTNVQRRLSAIHNMDPLWYPSDDEQRNGRGIRQGNMNPEIGINDYATKGTYDSTMWGMMAKKGRFIEGFFEGDPSLRDMEDLGEASQYEQAKAMTTNDPRLIRFTELKQDLERANRRKNAFESDVYNTRQLRQRAGAQVDHYTQRIDNTKKDIAQRVDTRGDKFAGKVTTGQKSETFPARVDFGKALFDRLGQIEDTGTLKGGIKIAEVGGFAIHAKVHKSNLIKDHTNVDVEMVLNGGTTREVSYDTSSLGTVRSIESILHGFESDLVEYEDRLAKAAKFFKDSEAKANAKFEGDAEITALKKQVDDLAAELRADVAATPAAPAPEAPTEGAELADMSGVLTPLAEEKHEAISKMLTAIVRAVAGDIPKIEFHKGLIPLTAPKGYGGMTGAGGSTGSYKLGKAVIKLALTNDADQMAKTAMHESYHHVEDRLQNDAERELMKRETPRLREYIKGRTGLTDAQVDGLAGYEVRAFAFQTYAGDRIGAKTKKGFEKVHIGVRRWFERLMDLLARIRNGLKGLGFTSYRDVFDDTFTGKMADRPDLKTGGVDEDDLASLADIYGAVSDRVQGIGNKLGIDLTEFRVQIQDRFIRVRHAQESVGGVRPSQDTYQAESLKQGRTGEQLEQLETRVFDPMIEDMKTRNITLAEMGDYLYAKHAPEANAAAEEINHPDLDIPGARDLRGRGSGMSNEDAAAIMDGITAAGRMADFEDVERQVRLTVDDTRDYLVASGLLSQEAADAWAAKFDFYVPLRGFADTVMEDELYGRGMGNDTRAAASKQRFGRLSKADNPLVYVMMQAELAIVRGEKNRVGNTFFRFVRGNPDKARWEIEPVPTKKAIDPRTGLVTEVPDDSWRYRDDVFMTRIGGKPYAIQLKGNDGKNLARALKNMGTSNLNLVLRLMHSVTTTMARMSTQLNPEFMLTNFERDLGEAFINLQAQQQQHFVKQFSKHLFPAIKGSFDALRGAPGGAYAQAFREFDADGGRIRFFGLDNHEDVKANIEKQMRRLEGGLVNGARGAAEAAIHGMEIVNGSIENATRLAAYMAARDVGMTRPASAMLALNLTTNFTKKGELGPIISALWMFGGAAIQGQVRVAQALTSKRVRRAVYGLIAANALAAMFAMLAGGDDDADENYYTKIPDYVRDKNLIIMWPKGMGHDGQYFKIPMPLGFAAFGVIGARLTSMVLGKDKPKDAAWAIFKGILDAANPLGEESSVFGSVLPSAFRPGQHIASNKNWTGNPLYPEREYEKHKPDSEQAFRSASPFSRFVARKANELGGGSPYKSSGWLDWHPASIDHVLESITGGLGKFVSGVVKTGYGLYNGEPFDATKAPITRRFVGTANSPEADQAAYYRDRDDARKNSGQAVKDARKDSARGVNREAADSFLAENGSTRGEQIFKNATEQAKPRYQRLERIEADKSLSSADRAAQVTAVKQEIREIQNRARKQYRDDKDKRQGAP